MRARDAADPGATAFAIIPCEVSTQVTPSVGHELFKAGKLISKTPQMELLAAGNPVPETFAISPLYQITIDKDLKREPAVAWVDV